MFATCALPMRFLTKDAIVAIQRNQSWQQQACLGIFGMVHKPNTLFRSVKSLCHSFKSVTFSEREPDELVSTYHLRVRTGNSYRYFTLNSTTHLRELSENWSSILAIRVRFWEFALYIPHNVLERTLKCIKRNLGINAV